VITFPDPRHAKKAEKLLRRDFPVNTWGDPFGYLTEVTQPASNGGDNSQRRGIHLDSELSSYDALIRPIQDQMLRSIWRITQVAEDAEDALQESLILIWKRWARIERHPRPQALILRICVNCACDVLRARLRRRSREKALVDPNLMHAKDCPVEQQVHGQELRDDISRALLRLPSRQAMAVSMRYLLELPYEEIGDALGCSETTARVHVNRAHKTLSRLLAHLTSSYSTESTK
jgi:RNA polymerase sigma-70 factor (ECF subfamily)